MLCAGVYDKRGSPTTYMCINDICLGKRRACDVLRPLYVLNIIELLEHTLTEHCLYAHWLSLRKFRNPIPGSRIEKELHYWRHEICQFERCVQ